jgi:hypothetical protein
LCIPPPAVPFLPTHLTFTWGKSYVYLLERSNEFSDLVLAQFIEQVIGAG